MDRGRCVMNRITTGGAKAGIAGQRLNRAVRMGATPADAGFVPGTVPDQACARWCATTCGG